MKKIFAKQNILPVVILGTICLVVAALLGVVNMITSPIIEDANNKKANAALLVVLPDGKDFAEIELADDYPEEVSRAYKADIGYVFELKTRGKEQLTVMCGVDNDGKIVKIQVLSEQETPGYKEKVFPYVTGDEGKYNGKDSSNLEPELFAGATLTSNGIYDAVKAALNAYAVVAGGESIEEPEYVAPQSQREEEELVTLAGELVADAAGFTEVEFDAEANGVKYLAKVFKENSGKGYVAYVFSVSEYYGTVDTENLIHIGNDGTVKNIKKLTWEVSPENPEYGYNPPSKEKLNEFYAGLNGKDSSTIGEVDIHTGATNTTTTLVASITEALKIVGDIIKVDMPTPEEEILGVAAGMVGEGSEFSDVTPTERTFVKRVYRENGGKGYVAYLVVINERYNRIETETLVYVGNDGKIKDVKKLIWKTSDAGWGYEPPTEEAVNPFYESLKGKSLSDLEALSALETNDGQLVTNATSTSKALVGALIEGVKAIDVLLKKDMPTAEEQLFIFGKEMVADDAEFTNVTPEESTFVKRIYRENKGKGYLAYLVVINERYNRIETETLVYVGNDGKIKDVKKLIWKTSDAGWGYEPPTEEAVNPFYESLKGKSLSDLEALSALETNDGQLVTNATSTSKALVGALIEGVQAIEALIRKDMPRPEEEVISLAQQMAGEGASLENVTPGNVEFLKRLYRVNGSNAYVAYVVVINERYGRVETETMIHIGENGGLRNINKLTWKTSDAGWGYEPPTEEAVNPFYESLKGKSLSDLEALSALETNDGQLVTNATSTSKALIGALIEAVKSATALNVEPDGSGDLAESGNAPKIIGIALISIVVIVMAGCIIIPKTMRRRKNG